MKSKSFPTLHRQQHHYNSPLVQPLFYESTRILFVCKEYKNNNFIQQFLLFRVNLHRRLMKVPWHMCVVLLMQEDVFIYHEKHVYALVHLFIYCKLLVYCKLIAEHHMNTAIQIRCLSIMWMNLIWITRAQFVRASKVQATIQSHLHGINGSPATSLKRLKIKLNPSCPLDWEWDWL